MSHKPKSKISKLPPADREQVRVWLVDENLDYHVVKKLIAEQFGVDVSIGALSKHYARDTFDCSTSEARVFARHAKERAAQSHEDFSVATLALIEERAFLLAKAKGGDLEDLAILSKILGDTAKLELQKKQLTLSREKYEQTLRDEEETAIRALAKTVKDDPVVLEHYHKFRDALRAARAARTKAAA